VWSVVLLGSLDRSAWPCGRRRPRLQWKFRGPSEFGIRIRVGLLFVGVVREQWELIQFERLLELGIDFGLQQRIELRLQRLRVELGFRRQRRRERSQRIQPVSLSLRNARFGREERRSHPGGAA
jgi:hypothetical protein